MTDKPRRAAEWVDLLWEVDNRVGDPPHWDHVISKKKIEEVMALLGMLEETKKLVEGKPPQDIGLQVKVFDRQGRRQPMPVITVDTKKKPPTDPKCWTDEIERRFADVDIASKKDRFWCEGILRRWVNDLKDYCPIKIHKNRD